MAVKDLDKWLRGYLLVNFEQLGPGKQVSPGQLITDIENCAVPEFNALDFDVRYEMITKHLHKLVVQKFLWPAVSKRATGNMTINFYEIRQRNAKPI